ncbi:MAG: hypothetical protein AB7U81_08130 [Thiohalomonadaceae bacterium]
MRLRDVFTASHLQEPLNGARADLGAFLEASLVMVNEAQLRGTSARTGLCLYAWGAARSLARHHRLNPAQRRRLVRDAVQTIARNYPVDCAPACHGPARRAAMGEGAAVADNWLMGENDAPLRCAQLLAEWRAGRE